MAAGAGRIHGIQSNSTKDTQPHDGLLHESQNGTRDNDEYSAPRKGPWANFSKHADGADLELAADAGTANMYEQIMTVISNLISISVVDMAPIIS